MNGYQVVTYEDKKVGTVVGETGDFLIVEQGALRKSKHAVPREFAKVDESEQTVRLTVPKNLFCDSPKLNGEFDERAVAEHYGIASSAPAPGTEGFGDTTAGDPSRSSEEQARRDGVMPAAEERAQMREGTQEGGALPAESPGLLGDRVAGSEERDR